MTNRTETERHSSLPAGGPGTPDEDDEVVVGPLRLRALRHAGPFWEGEGHLSDDVDVLGAWLGASRGLIEDALAWARAYQDLADDPGPAWRRRHWDQQQVLLRRLADEVSPGIEVEPALDEPPATPW
ncbi:hypothetical protein [Nocardioides bruguierae]|uniref:hypothetical protein n=1 Tax=Nocardioides bruguierae TaxID=2945102 RepID=UPI0020227C41|nr:hypothetical protein [Nocardioides bruguierae]MCL8025770.1 hypothetical protein [Nocardioides bruguierae]